MSSLFYSVDIEMRDGSKRLRFCEWNDSPAAGEEEINKRLQRLSREVDQTGMKLGAGNGTLHFVFAEKEVIFPLLHTVFVSNTKRNKKRGHDCDPGSKKRHSAQHYKIVGMLREVVVANLNGQNGEPQVVPKFGVAPLDKNELLRIRNYDRYIEWCTLLRDQVTRKDGVDTLVWTPPLQSGMEDIYDLKPMGEVPMYMHIISIA